MKDKKEFIEFLITAKKATYAGNSNMFAESCRNASKDLKFEKGKYVYLDSYFGGFAFIGNEILWENNVPIYGMNYYGTMLIDSIPEGFSSFLKKSLLIIPNEAPYRGPREFHENEYSYFCEWEGPIETFKGYEYILLNNSKIYELNFHGGIVRD